MTNRERALNLDEQDKPIEAAEAYEQAISAREADLDVFLNLTLIYFDASWDYGYQYHHHIPVDFQVRAHKRLYQLLDECEKMFGKRVRFYSGGDTLTKYSIPILRFLKK